MVGPALACGGPVILGLGCDLIGIARLRGVLERHGDRFLERILSPAERAYCLAARDPAERTAVRWAAKEATMKALGTGWSHGVTFAGIEVLHDAAGAPQLQLHAGAAQRAAVLGVTRCHLSLSHADGMAMAMVVLES